MRFRGGGVGHRYARAFEHQLGELSKLEELEVDEEADVMPMTEAIPAQPGRQLGDETRTDSEGEDEHSEDEDEDENEDDGDEDEEDSEDDEGYDSNDEDEGLGAEDGEAQDDPYEDGLYADM